MKTLGFIEWARPVSDVTSARLPFLYPMVMILLLLLLAQKQKTKTMDAAGQDIFLHQKKNKKRIYQSIVHFQDLYALGISAGIPSQVQQMLKHGRLLDAAIDIPLVHRPFGRWRVPRFQSGHGKKHSRPVLECRSISWLLFSLLLLLFRNIVDPPANQV